MTYLSASSTLIGPDFAATGVWDIIFLKLERNVALGKRSSWLYLGASDEDVDELKLCLNSGTAHRTIEPNRTTEHNLTANALARPLDTEICI